MELWYRLSPEDRRAGHSVTVEYVPPSDQPMTLSLADLAYPLSKLTITVSARIGQAELEMKQAGYKEMHVAHGEARLETGNLGGSSVHFVMTEQQGQLPKGAVRLSAHDGTPPVVRVVDLNLGDRSPATDGKGEPE